MATCIINSKANHAFILYEEIIKQGVILIFDSNKQFLFSHSIHESNSTELILPEIDSKFNIVTYYNDIKLIKEVHIGIEQNN